MSRTITRNGGVSVRGRLAVPGDKSITHRALIFSALARGRAKISNILASADCLNTLECLRRVGVPIDLNEGGPEALVEGVGLFGLTEPDDVLDVGNSGTALRVLPGVLSGQDFLSVITGDDSIRRRPIGRIIEPLSLMGADIRARKGGRLAPMAISGAGLKGVQYTLPVASAQVKTAVLAAGLLAEGVTTVVEPVASRDHTEIMLKYLGAPIEIGEEKDGRTISVRQSDFTARDIKVPGDISSAAFFLGAGILAGNDRIEVENVGLNPTRSGFIEAASMMNAEVSAADERVESGEIVGTLVAGRSELKAARIGGSLIPRIIDELPLIALLATQAGGTTEIKDAAELRVKETDRIAAVSEELAKMGARIIPMEDGFRITGPTKLKGAAVDGRGDHRLVMMLAVASIIAEGQTVIHGADAVDISFPDFFSRLERVEIS